MNLFNRIFLFILFYYKIFFYKPIINTTSTYNICIILAGGNSSRFGNIFKQTYILNNIPIFMYSVNVFKKYCDKVIIVSNDKCHDFILKNVECDIDVITSNDNERIDSIFTTLKYINNNYKNVNKVIIHDAARPFINDDVVINLLNSKSLYTHYCMKLTNGLINDKYCAFDRNKYYELCSPICINYNLCYFIHEHFINNHYKYTCEYVEILKYYNINIELLFEKYNILRKITYYSDVQ